MTTSSIRILYIQYFYPVDATNVSNNIASMEIDPKKLPESIIGFTGFGNLQCFFLSPTIQLIACTEFCYTTSGIMVEGCTSNTLVLPPPIAGGKILCIKNGEDNIEGIGTGPDGIFTIDTLDEFEIWSQANATGFPVNRNIL